MSSRDGGAGSPAAGEAGFDGWDDLVDELRTIVEDTVVGPTPDAPPAQAAAPAPPRQQTIVGRPITDPNLPAATRSASTAPAPASPAPSRPSATTVSGTIDRRATAP